MRRYLLQLTLLFGPLILLFVYYYLTQAGKKARAAGKGGWRSVAYALAIGVALNVAVLLAIVLSATSSGSGRDDIYIPPYVDDEGNVVPGQFVPREERPDDATEETAP